MLLISGDIHLAALLLLGIIIVYKYIISDDAQFEEPPSVQEEICFSQSHSTVLEALTSPGTSASCP